MDTIREQHRRSERPIYYTLKEKRVPTVKDFIVTTLHCEQVVKT